MEMLHAVVISAMIELVAIIVQTTVKLWLADQRRHARRITLVGGVGFLLLLWVAAR